MSTDVALRPSGRLQIDDGQDFWTPEQVAALSVLGIKGATNGDLAVFFHYCRRTQLDPFSRQIYMIPRRERVGDQWVNKQTIQVGIDGFRVVRDRVAERTGCQVEFEDTVWYDKDGTAHAVWLSAEAPAACQVVLVKYQAGRKLRFPAVLRTASYIQVNGRGEPVSQWRTQPEHMIEKCCEAFATRRAFPNDFSGVYLEDELNGRTAADRPVAEHRPVTVAEIITAEPERPQRKRPGKTELAQADQLQRLLHTLPIGPDETREQDELSMLSWLAGHDFTGNAADTAAALSGLEQAVTDAGGDLEAAVTDLWTRYEASKADGDA